MIYRIILATLVLVAGYLSFELIRGYILQNMVLSAPTEHVLGNPNGDVTLVKYLDYNCFFCREAHPIVMEAIQRDGNVKFIIRPVDLVEPDPINQSRLPYAAAKKGKFAEMHEALNRNDKIVDEQVMQDLALEIGIDPTQFKEDYESKEIIDAAQENIDFFTKFRINGTPTYMIGRKIMFTPSVKSPDVNDFLAIFEESRTLE